MIARRFLNAACLAAFCMVSEVNAGCQDQCCSAVRSNYYPEHCASSLYASSVSTAACQNACKANSGCLGIMFPYPARTGNCRFITDTDCWWNKFGFGIGGWNIQSKGCWAPTTTAAPRPTGEHACTNGVGPGHFGESLDWMFIVDFGSSVRGAHPWNVYVVTVVSWVDCSFV